MAGNRARIDIFVPADRRFPELSVVGGYRDMMQFMIPRLRGGQMEQSTIAEVTANAMSENARLGFQADGEGESEALGDGEGEGRGRSLFVYDWQGKLLEHVRYLGNDYRGALRAAFNVTPNHWED